MVSIYEYYFVDIINGKFNPNKGRFIHLQSSYKPKCFSKLFGKQISIGRWKFRHEYYHYCHLNSYGFLIFKNDENHNECIPLRGQKRPFTKLNYYSKKK